MARPTTNGVSRPRLSLGLALLGLVLSATVGASLATGAQAAAGRTITFEPSRIGFSSAEIPNSMRGQYRWLGQAPQPAGSPAPDTYYRDQVRWGAIEPSEGSYDFSRFDDGLADAATHRGKFGFRVMAWCPGCWTEDPNRDVPRTTPAWIPLQPNRNIPDWNSSVFLDHWDALMKALGDRYRGDRRLGWVEVGGYGKYGEWHTDGEGTGASPASIRRIIRAVYDNFPQQHVVINAMSTEGVKQAMALSPRIGIRMDCLGLSDFFYPFDHSTAIGNRWKTAPVTTEWCHSPAVSTLTGASQVRKYHVSTVSRGNTAKTYAQMTKPQRAGWRSSVKHSGFRYQLRSLTVPRKVHSGKAFSLLTKIANLGSAPTYDGWRVELRLLDAGNHVVARSSLGIDLRGLLPGSRRFARSTSLSVAPGRYRIGVAVVDPTGYLAPMRLATRGRIANGTYPLGKVTVTR